MAKILGTVATLDPALTLSILLCVIAVICWIAWEVEK